MKKLICMYLSAAMVLGLSGCGSLNNAAKGGLLGGGAGAALGAGIGALIGKGKGAAIGGAIGAIAGGTAGTLIGKKMDKQAKELAEIEGAKVESVNDADGLPAIKVTFDGGILFGFNKSDLSATAKNSLTNFATSLKDNPDTNVQIFGFTDNVGTRAANDKVSQQRADTVKKFLSGKGVASSRLTSQGMAWDYPVASNDTEDGRAQNRRVEVYISANDEMISEAEAGTLQ